MARILVIEDEDSIRSIVKAMLEMSGFTVETAKTGREGIEAHHRERPDLVICGLRLPDLGGMDMVRALRQEDPKVKVLVTSGGDAGEAERASLAVLRKPFGLAELLSAIGGVLDLLPPG